jgi:hypothetical protein
LAALDWDREFSNQSALCRLAMLLTAHTSVSPALVDETTPFRRGLMPVAILILGGLAKQCDGRAHRVVAFPSRRSSPGVVPAMTPSWRQRQGATSSSSASRLGALTRVAAWLLASD